MCLQTIHAKKYLHEIKTGIEQLYSVFHEVYWHKLDKTNPKEARSVRLLTIYLNLLLLQRPPVPAQVLARFKNYRGELQSCISLLTSTVRERIQRLEKTCISRGCEIQERGNKLAKITFEKSPNLLESAKASQAKLSDATGWGDRQPITAGDTDDAVLSSPRQSLYRDWSQGEDFWAPSESEEGGQVGD